MDRTENPGDRGFRETAGGKMRKAQKPTKIGAKLRAAIRPSKMKLILAGAALISLMAGAVALNSMFTLAVVDGYSMYPTYQSGDLVLISKHRDPEIHDTVTARVKAYPQGDILKRLSGVPGSRVMRNGKGNLHLMGENQYWLGSDANRYTGHEGTTDSSDFGPVRRENINGVVIWKTRFAKGILEDKEVVEKFRAAQNSRGTRR